MPCGKHENKLKQQSQLVDLCLGSGNLVRLKFWFSFLLLQVGESSSDHPSPLTVSFCHNTIQLKVFSSTHRPLADPKKQNSEKPK